MDDDDDDVDDNVKIHLSFFSHSMTLSLQLFVAKDEICHQMKCQSLSHRTVFFLFIFLKWCSFMCTEYFVFIKFRVMCILVSRYFILCAILCYRFASPCSQKECTQIKATRSDKSDEVDGNGKHTAREIERERVKPRDKVKWRKKGNQNRDLKLPTLCHPQSESRAIHFHIQCTSL